MKEIDEKYFDTKRAAKFLQLHPGTLPNWRRRGLGPKYIKLGQRKVLYRKSDLEEYLTSCVIETFRRK